MKNIFALGLLTLTTLSIASNTSIEFDEKQEVACYNEARKLGCVPGNGEAKLSCVEKSKKKLSKACLAMHNSKRITK